MERLTSGSKSTCIVTKGKLISKPLLERGQITNQIWAAEKLTKSGPFMTKFNAQKNQADFFKRNLYALIFQQCNAISEIIQSSFPNCSKLKFRRFGPKIFS